MIITTKDFKLNIGASNKLSLIRISHGNTTGKGEQLRY